MDTRIAGDGRRILAIAIALVLGGCSAGSSPAPSETPTLVTPSIGPGAAPTPSTPPPTVAPTATAAPAIAWEPVASFQMEGDLAGMAAGPAGYVVLELPRTAWFSVDGRAWASSELPFEGGTINAVELRAHVNDVVSSSDGFLVVGGYDHAPCSATQGAGGPPSCAVSPISWVSSDGVTWRSTQSNQIPSDGSALPAYSEIVHAWQAGGGWDAAVEARDSVRYHGNTILHSLDGLAWSRLQSAPLPTGASSGEDVFVHAGVGAPDGRRLVWQVFDTFDGIATPPVTTLSSSSDGLSWTPSSEFDGVGVVVRLGLAPDDGSERWLILGNGGQDGVNVARSWVSDDLRTWRGGPVDDPLARATVLSSVDRWAGGYIVQGRDEDVPGIGTWLSADGLTWSEVVSSRPAASDVPAFLAMGPAGLVGVGIDDYRAQTWLAVGS